jgi:AcrR family transcriptional regulator
LPKVSESYKEKKRQELLSSAMACFAEKGYAQATIDDIVQHSGMSKGAVYNYFNSKEEIYLMLLDRAIEGTFDKFKKAFQEDLTATEKVCRLFQVYQSIDFKSDQMLKWRSVQLEFWVNASRHEELNEKLVHHSRKAIHFIAEILEEGIRSGEFRQDLDKTLAAETFWSFADGLFLHVLVEKEKYPYAAMYESFEKMFLNDILSS